MKTKNSKHINILLAKEAYANGQNVTEVLRKQLGISGNDSTVIETAYDLQAGTYIEYVENHRDTIDAYVSELAQFLAPHIDAGDTLLDAGTGEMTSLSLILQRLPVKPQKTYAFDISWSRIWHGLSFARQTLDEKTYKDIVPFIAGIEELPLPSNSIDVIFTCHALEPNGGREDVLLAELLRVCRKKLVLFEPCYEINSPEGQNRMERLGYVRGLAQAVEKLGGRIVAQTPLKHVTNPLNPTVCFEISPPLETQAENSKQTTLTVPGTNYPLNLQDGFLFSNDTGLAFPVIKGIPVLRSESAILVSAMASSDHC